MWEIYMMATLNFKMSWDQYPPVIGNPGNADSKVGDLILIKNQAPHLTFDGKYKLSYLIMKKIGEKALMCKTQPAREECLQNT